MNSPKTQPPESDRKRRLREWRESVKQQEEKESTGSKVVTSIRKWVKDNLTYDGRVGK